MGGGMQGCPLNLQGRVVTLAGSGFLGGDVEGRGSSAKFSGLGAWAANGSFAFGGDIGNKKIKKIDLRSADVAIIAGPAAGAVVSGDADGSSAVSTFNDPQMTTLSGNALYVVDGTNNKIRRIDLATGIVSTFAGPSSGTTTFGDTDGVGNTARFFAPTGITTDGTNLYVVENGNCKIRRVSLATQQVTTIVGPLPGSNGCSLDNDGIGNAARLFAPGAITTDGKNLFVSDNSKIRKVDLNTLQVTTIAGPAPGSSGTGHVDAAGTAARFGSILGLATDGFSLFVSESYYVRVLNPGTQVVNTLAGDGNLGLTDGVGPGAQFTTQLRLSASDGAHLILGDGNNVRLLE